MESEEPQLVGQVVRAIMKQIAERRLDDLLERAAPEPELYEARLLVGVGGAAVKFLDRFAHLTVLHSEARYGLRRQLYYRFVVAEMDEYLHLFPFARHGPFVKIWNKHE